MSEPMPLLTPIDTARTSLLYRNAPIAVTDSGVGGLSILREIRQLLPHEDIIFLADQAHVPYGQKTLDEVRHYEEGITRFFLTRTKQDGRAILEAAKLIVVACNTASAAALHYLRETFPQIKFVGLEPAIKPAALHSQKKRIGVIATAATFQGELYASLIDRFAKDVEVFPRACPELVELVEQDGEFDDAARTILANALQPFQVHDVDKLVLGCTHFPFLRPHIDHILGAGVEVIDPSRAVAKQVARVLEREDALTTRNAAGQITAITTGDILHFEKQLTHLLDFPIADVRRALWQLGHLVLRV